MKRLPVTLARCLFLRRTDGATAVEFALIAFPFLAVLGGIFELAYVQFENALLQGALTNAFRQMTTGQMQATNVRDAASFVKTFLCQQQGRTLPSNFDCSRLIVSVGPVSNFSSADLSSGFYRNASNPFCPGSPGQISVVKVAYPLDVVFPLNLYDRTVGVVSDVPGRAGTKYHLLMGAALFQTENFSGSYVPPPGC